MGLSLDDATKLYEEDVVARECNLTVVEILRDLDMQKQRQARWLFEVGSGTGGTTSFVLPTLSNWSSRYIFSDLSQAFLVNARARFGEAFPFVEYTIFNGDLDPGNQGFNIHFADELIGTNVIHATKHLPVTLCTIHRLLNQEGHLIFNEVQNCGSHVDDLTFGLTEGWYLFEDLERRQTYPLLPAPGWGTLFSLCGFNNTFHTPDQGIFAIQQVCTAQVADVKLLDQPVMQNRSADPSGSYLFTGGVGGLGLLSAQILIERGCKSLFFVSRRDRVPIEAMDHFERVRNSSCTIIRQRCNASDAIEVRKLFETSGNPRILGVIHAAGVLSDGTISRQTREKYSIVFQPKFFGALHLHRLTLNLAWDQQLYIQFSSGAGFFGSHGQSNHSSANAGLEGMVGYRNALGLCGTSIAWGAIAEIGYAARHNVLGDTQGYVPFDLSWAALETVTYNPGIVMAISPPPMHAGGGIYAGVMGRFRNMGQNKKPMMSSSSGYLRAREKKVIEEQAYISDDEGDASGSEANAVFDTMAAIHDQWTEGGPDRGYQQEVC